MFNKITLRTTLQQPLPQSVAPASTSVVCILKSTALSGNPTIVPPGQVNQYKPEELLSVVQTNDNIVFQYTYHMATYVESVNFLRIVSGLANLVFAS